MDKIFINDLLVRGIIGISEKERENPQDILINVTMECDTSIGAGSDNIEDCVNYRTVAKKILALVETAKRNTVEALAEDISKLSLEDKKVVSVLVRVEKPGAVRFAKTVGVEIERHQLK